MSQENKQEKRKKDVVMSLDEFNMHYTTDRNIDSEKPEKLPSETKFDDFSYLQDVTSFDLKKPFESFVMSPGLLICYSGLALKSLSPLFFSVLEEK